MLKKTLSTVKLYFGKVKGICLKTTLTKITTGLIVAAVVGGGVGAVYYINKPSKLPEYKIAGTDAAPKDKELNRSKEEKQKDDKQVKVTALKDEIKKLNPNAELNDDENITEEQMDELINKYEGVKRELVEKKEKEESSKEDTSTGGGNSSTGGGNTSTGGGSSSTGGDISTGGGSSSTGGGGNTEAKPPVVTPDPVPEVPAIASGWKDDVAQYCYSQMATGITNVPSGFRTQAQLDTMSSLVNGWFNGSGISIASINQQMKDKYLKDTDFPLQLVTLKTFSVKGLNSDTISNSCFANSNSAGQVGYLFVRVYYDSSTDTSTIYLVDGK